MKYLVQEIDGQLLDAAVATALRGAFVAYGEHHSIHSVDKKRNSRPAILNPGFVEYGGEVFAPSSNWAHGGPIIEREEILLAPIGGGHGWCASVSKKAMESISSDMPLVAAMRALVCSRLGAEVDL